MVVVKPRKGVFFSLDAILALTVIITIVGGIGVYYSVVPELEYRGKHAEAEDIMSFLSNTDAGEISAVDEYVDESNEDSSLLELVGSYWVSDNKTAAEDILETVVGDKDGTCWEMKFGDESIESGCDEDDTVSVASRVASGYAVGEEPEGYITRGQLSESDSLLQNSHIFFGGYVGDGNITRNITLENMKDVENVTMELDAGGNFSLFINGNFSGDYFPKSGELRADRWKIEKQYWDNLKPGENKIDFNFTGGNSSLSGGFFHVRYNVSEVGYSKGEEGTMRLEFPGIYGVINLYGSFYSPGEIQNMSAQLNYRSDYNISMILGNVTVYEGSTDGQKEEVEVTDEEISSRFKSSRINYSDISRRTVPLRLGLSNVTELKRREADMFSVVDISGSMGTCDVPADSDNYDCSDSCFDYDTFCCWWSEDCGTQSGCESCDGTWLDYSSERLTVAKNSTKDFIDIVLNVSENRAGVTGYNDVVDETDTHNLSRNNSSLRDTVDDWVDDGSTCICCGVNDATGRLVNQSNESRYRSMVVMSDGEANVECEEQGTGSAKEDAIQAACDAYQNYGIDVYTVGFGPKDEVDNETLQSMANCSEGKYYYSELGELREKFRNVTQDMLEASYEEQELIVREEDTENITLYPDSYLEFNYTDAPSGLQYGEIPIDLRSDNFGGEVESPKEGKFWVGNASRPLEAKVTSYSSEFWTSLVNISNDMLDDNVYDLSKYSENYEKTGDPYTVNLPAEKIGQGNNTVYLDTSSSAGNFAGGSPDSRVIYTVAVNGSVGYGDSFPKYEGGNVTVELATGESYNLSVGNSSDVWDPERDAMDDMVERLLDKLDVNDDGKVDMRISEENLEISDTKTGGIRYFWGPGIFTLKMW
ncbi:MAG: vWA domain-containing protein [Candidatus Aenigmatarchaeota archaeon]